MPKTVRKEALYFGFLALTLALILWQQFGMNTRFSFALEGRNDYKVVTDDINNGHSQGIFELNNGHPKLSCDITPSFTFGFCSLVLPLTESSLGVNLENYDTLTLELSYEATERDTLLVYLANHEQAQGEAIIRSNMQTLIPKQGRHSYTLELNHFYVPSWWVFSLPELNSSEPKLDQVREIQISTGDHRGARHIEVTLHRFEFKGKLIRSEPLYLNIIGFWLLVALLEFILVAKRFKRRYQGLREETEKLNQLNLFLQIERDKYEGLAKHDSLTGCLNRNGLRDVLQQVLKAFRHDQKPAILMLLDLDSFKHLNDTYGHDEGDRVLVNLTQLLQQHIRESDHLIRWGGEEFAVVCENTSAAGALTLADHLRKQIEASPLSQHIKVTASFGVAPLMNEQVEEWFKIADEALYQAKSSGKNQVIVAECYPQDHR